MTTGNRIRKLRKAKGLNAEALAEMCGVSPATIYRYENGDIENFGYDKLIPLAKALNVDPAYLLGIEKTANSTVDGLSDYDIKMLAWFHSLAPEQRKAILTLGGAPAELAEVPDCE